MAINGATCGRNLYRATWKSQTVEVYADSEMKARERACKHMGCKTQRKAEVKVVLA